MDAVISSSASVTGSFLQVQHQLQLPLRTVSAYASTSSSVPLSQKQRQRQRQRQSLSSHRIRLTFRNYSSALPKLRVTCGSAVTEINESQFKETVLKANRPVLVEFVATWCGPCRLISPVIESLAQEYEDRLMVVKIDHDANPRLIEEYKVYGLPTLILFKNGEEVPESRREGASAKEKLRVYLDALLESISVS